MPLPPSFFQAVGRAVASATLLAIGLLGAGIVVGLAVRIVRMLNGW